VLQINADKEKDIVKTRIVVVGFLLVALNSPMPVSSQAQEIPAPTNGGSRTSHSDPVTADSSGGTNSHTGIIAVTVTVLGLLALAASSGSSNSTPAATNH